MKIRSTSAKKTVKLVIHILLLYHFISGIRNLKQRRLMLHNRIFKLTRHYTQSLKNIRCQGHIQRNIQSCLLKINEWNYETNYTQFLKKKWRNSDERKLDRSGEKYWNIVYVRRMSDMDKIQHNTSTGSTYFKIPYNTSRLPLGTRGPHSTSCFIRQATCAGYVRNTINLSLFRTKRETMK
jgi:hypothetical protein